MQDETEQTSKRTKERSISDIIEKVSLWRKLYNGVTRDGNLVRYSLEDAASKVGVSKKSLDDYLLQLRFGKKYGFDFQKHRSDKVGVLRSYVKSQKTESSKMKDVSKSEKMSSMSHNGSEFSTFKGKGSMKGSGRGGKGGKSFKDWELAASYSPI